MMADGGENRDGVYLGGRRRKQRRCRLRVINHCSAHHRRAEDLDLISSLPDVILHEILSFLPTKSAITTSVLSKRWRHVWSETPSLYFDSYRLKDDSINKTLAQHRARKIMTFHLHTDMSDNLPWIEFVKSRNVENLLLDFFDIHNLPDLFYVNSSVKQLSINLGNHGLIPRCSVSWESLKKLSLRHCNISDESIDKILSGCPILENLTLYLCDQLRVLDLSKSPRLRILDIGRNFWIRGGPTHIVAPHIHCLRLINSQLSCTFVDVSSLTEVKLDLCFCSIGDLEADFLQDMVLKMLDKLQNVERLTFGANFLKILSLAEVRGVPFPMFKAKTLTLETIINQYVIPGIVRVLQNSPDLKKLTVHTVDSDGDPIPDKCLGKYLDLHGLNEDQCRVFKNISHRNVESKHMASFMELMLKTTKTLEKMVVRLESYLDGRKFEELLEMVPVLSRNNNVSIVLSSAKRSQSV